jgi:hypothetical protein
MDESGRCLINVLSRHDPGEAEANQLSQNLNVQTGSEAHPASYTVGTGSCLPRGKSTGA